MGLFHRILYALGAPLHKGRAEFQPALYEGRSPLWDNTEIPGARTYSRPSVDTSVNDWQHDNYFNPLPNPEFNLKTGYSISPYRLHAPWRYLQPNEPTREPGVSPAVYINTATPAPGSPPSQVPAEIQKKSFAPTQIRQRGIDKTADTPWDAGSYQNLQKEVFLTPSQRYFDQRIPLPEFTTPSFLAHQVIVPEIVSQFGWMQVYVPEPGMRENEVGVTHPTLQSRPINVKTVQTVNPGARQPVKATAPKAKKTTGR